MLTANVLHHVFCEDLSPESRLQHVEPRQRDGESEQLYLIVGILERIRPHRRQPEVIGSLYQASHAVKFVTIGIHLPVISMSLPKKRGLAFAREREGTATDQYHHLLHLGPQTLHEVGKPAVSAARKSLTDNGLRKLCLQALQMHEADISRLAMKRGQVFAHVDTRQMHNTSSSA